MTTDDIPNPAMCKAFPHFIGQCDDFDAEPRWCCPIPPDIAERVAAELAAARNVYRGQPHPEGGYLIRLAYFTDFNRVEVAFLPKTGFTDHTGIALVHGVSVASAGPVIDLSGGDPEANPYRALFTDEPFTVIDIEQHRERIFTAMGIGPSDPATAAIMADLDADGLPDHWSQVQMPLIDPAHPLIQMEEAHRARIAQEEKPPPGKAVVLEFDPEPPAPDGP